MNSPIRWLGGKGNIKKQILPFFTEHVTYVEPFGGGASLLLAKTPSRVEVYNDIDSGLINFFRVLRDRDKFKEFYRQVQLIPYSREEFNYCRDVWEDDEDEVGRAVKWFVVARQSFGGGVVQRILENGKTHKKGWGNAITSSCRNMADTVSTWLSCIEMLPEIHKRLRVVQIEHKDFREVIKQYDTENTLFYCDPPYVADTRQAVTYKHELDNQDHKDLIDMLLQVEGKVILSCYYSNIYKPLVDNKWVRHDIKTACYVVARTKQTGLLGKGVLLKNQSRTETILINNNHKEETLFDLV